MHPFSTPWKHQKTLRLKALVYSKLGKFEPPKNFWSLDISIFLKSEKGLELKNSVYSL